MELSNQDKVKGMFVGLFLGDALGVPYERRPIPKVSDKLIYPIRNFNRYLHVYKNSIVGQITDDSEMTLALLYSMVENKGYNKEATLFHYFDWAHLSKCPFLGKNTRKLLTIKTIKGYEKRYKEVFSLPENEWTQSNGCLMRCGSLFLSSDEDIITDCKLTNPHPINLECNLIYCHSLKRLYQGMESKKVYQMAVEESKLTREILVGKTLNYGENKGLAINAFQLAMKTLLDDRSYQEQINDIIFNNLSGDTDTNACIAGAMLGMRFGFNQLMLNPVTKFNWEIVLAADTNKGDYPRPDKYHPKHLDKLLLSFSANLYL